MKRELSILDAIIVLRNASQNVASVGDKEASEAISRFADALLITNEDCDKEYISYELTSERYKEAREKVRESYGL